jgi:hypothetical protein
MGVTPQSKLASEERSAFLEDRRIREQENQLRFNTYQEKIEQLEEMRKEQQEINHRTMKGTLLFHSARLQRPTH